MGLGWTRQALTRSEHKLLFLCPCNTCCLVDEKCMKNQEAALGSACLKISLLV